MCAFGAFQPSATVGRGREAQRGDSATPPHGRSDLIYWLSSGGNFGSHFFMKGSSAMSIFVVCKCGRKFKAPDHAAGRSGKCPHCGQTRA